MQALAEQSLEKQRLYPSELRRQRSSAVYRSVTGGFGHVGAHTFKQGLTPTRLRVLEKSASQFSSGYSGSLIEGRRSLRSWAVQSGLVGEVVIPQPEGRVGLLATHGTLGQSDWELRRSLLVEQVKDLLENGAVDKARKILESQSVAFMSDERLLKLSRVIRPGRVVTHDTRGPDRKAEMAWIKSNASDYKGKWVAVLGDSLVASGKDLKSVLASVRKQQFKTQPLIHRIV